MKTKTRQTTRGIRREMSEQVVGVKLNQSLIDAIDRDGRDKGLTRSAIIRGHLMNAYRDQLPKHQ